MLAAVRCHAPTKHTGDAFARDFCRFIENAPKSTQNDKRQLFVCAALILIPRSERMLQYFCERGTALSLDTVGGLYSYFVGKHGSVYPGLQHQRQAHTSEQKLTTLGALIDAVLVPFLLDTCCYDAMLDLGSTMFIVDSSNCALLRGPFVSLHFNQYCHLAGIMLPPVETAKSNGKSSDFFLSITGLPTWTAVAQQVQPHLRFRVDWWDVSASACMTLRLLRCLMSGSTLGKHRTEPITAKKSKWSILIAKRLQNLPDLDVDFCHSAVLYAGCRYATARTFLVAVGHTHGSSPLRQILTDNNNYKQGEVLAVKCSQHRIGHFVAELAGEDAVLDHRCKRLRLTTTSQDSSTTYLYRVSAMARLAAKIPGNRACHSSRRLTY